VYAVIEILTERRRSAARDDRPGIVAETTTGKK